MLEHYRREYTDFNQQWMREYYLFLSGQKEDLELTRIYERYGDLFTEEAVIRLQKLYAEASPEFESQQKSINRLLRFATDQFLENAAKSLTEEISRFESRSSIEWEGREITYQGALVAIKSERRREARRAIYERRARLIEASNDLRAERVSRLHDGARRLGYEQYTALYEDLRRHDYAVLGRSARQFLEQTEAVYVKRLDEALRRDLHIKLEDAERVDALYFLNLCDHDEHFPASELMAVYRETFKGLGIETEKQANITIDTVERPRKSPRAFCAPVIIPEDIKLVLRPVGGQSDYQAIFHEAGHAQHYAWASPTLQPEFRYTGDYALTETYAFLFNYLPAEPDWLGEMLGFRDSRDYVLLANLTRLMMVRRYAAKLLYEYEMHTSDNVAGAPQIYAELQTDAIKFKASGVEFLADLDDGFYAASYLRAWAFEVALRDYLKSRFDKRWWTTKRAGDFLKEMWEVGDYYSADEMASQIGTGPITFELLTEEFNQLLK